MPFFQNPFPVEFQGCWVLGDRQASLTFKCPGNAGRGPESVIAWSSGPYNLSGNDADGNPTNVLTLAFAIKSDFRVWNQISVTLSGVSSSAVTPDEVVASLNANSNFSTWFTAKSQFGSSDPKQTAVNYVSITQKKPQDEMKFYVKNGGADAVLHFNARAGVAPLPVYFNRHTIANRYVFEDGQNMLIQLGTTGVDANIIDAAVDAKGNSKSFSHSTVPTDYELLAGRSGHFLFRKNTVDGSDRITQTILYQAGAKVGDFAHKIQYTYSGANKSPSTITEIPYVLQSGDILTP